MTNRSVGEWVLREELYNALQRWYVMVFLILAGGGIALGVSRFFQTDYRATVELAVELNPYRALDDRYVAAFASFEFRNVDDYKHWQMSQLNVLVYSDEFLQATLEKLRSKDQYWEPIQVSVFRKAVSARWRNAGAWSLSADAPTPELASDAVSTWRDVILLKTDEAIKTSRQLFQQEVKLRALNSMMFDLKARHTRLVEVKKALSAIQSEWSRLPRDHEISLRERWLLADLVAQSAHLDPVWEKVLMDLPAQDEEVEKYLEWIDRLNVLLESEMNFLDREIQNFDDQLAQANSEWTALLASARGLSATLSVESLQGSAPRVRPLRSDASLLLVGGISGLLAWCLLIIFQITSRGADR